MYFLVPEWSPFSNLCNLLCLTENNIFPADLNTKGHYKMWFIFHMLRNVQHKLQMEALLQYLCSVTNKICISNSMHPKAPSLHSLRLLVTYTLRLNTRKVMFLSLETQKSESAKNPNKPETIWCFWDFFWPMKNVVYLIPWHNSHGLSLKLPIY